MAEIPVSRPFVPDGFVVPDPPATGDFAFEVLGPQHNDPDLAAWTGSMAHIQATPGFVGRSWPVRVYTADENLQDLTFGIHGAPEIHLLSIDPDEHLIQMPPTCRWRSPPAQVRRDQRAKLDRPTADRLAADFDSALGQSSSTSRKLSVSLKYSHTSLLDHFDRKPMTLERDRHHENLHLSA